MLDMTPVESSTPPSEIHMLTDIQRDIIKATVPLLETGGEALTGHFYKLMLDGYPQVRPLFNQTHQASGSQQRALANAVLTYARNIDHLGGSVHRSIPARRSGI